MPFLEANSIRISYTERGSGDPLLLIMGITAPGAVWEKHASRWQSEFRCILPDNRGVGQTDKPPGPYTSAMMADDCVGLLDALSISRARVIGCSMGSTIAQEMMLRHPARVQSAVLMCPWARVDHYAAAIFDHMVSCKARLTPKEFATFIQLLIFSKRAWDDPALYQQMLEDRQAASLDPNPQPLFALQAQAAACTTHDALDGLRNVQCPCFVIGGSSDIFTPPWMAREIAAAIPKCELHLYDSAGHAFHWEHLNDFNERILTWLKAH